MITAHQPGRAQLQHTFVCLGAGFVDEPQIDARMLVAERQIWRRLALGMWPKTMGLPSVVPYAFRISAFGKVRLILSSKVALAGADPILRYCTDERSAFAIASRSSSIMAIIGGTAVSQVQRKRS